MILYVFDQISMMGFIKIYLDRFFFIFNKNFFCNLVSLYPISLKEIAFIILTEIFLKQISCISNIVCISKSCILCSTHYNSWDPRHRYTNSILPFFIFIFCLTTLVLAFSFSLISSLIFIFKQYFLQIPLAWHQMFHVRIITHNGKA